METVESVTLDVVPLIWSFRVTGRRQAMRKRHSRTSPFDSLFRWVERWHRRSTATLTRDPVIEYSDNVFNDFMMDRGRFVVWIWCLPTGQVYGLAPKVYTQAQALQFEAVNGRVFDRVTFWENAVSGRQGGD